MRRSLTLLLVLATPAAAQSGAVPFTVAETGQGFATLDDAVQSIRMGTATILIAPGVYKQCTVQAGGNITFKAAQPGTAIFDGETCEGKAAFVLRGLSSVVDGIVFRNLRVSDGNSVDLHILGSNLDNGERPQVVVPRQAWQAATSTGAFTLVGCTVAPGFQFSGFELADPDWAPGRD